MKYKVHESGTKVVGKFDGEYNDNLLGKKAITTKNTGNGWIIKWHSWNSVTQDYYVCLDYSQAQELVNTLALLGITAEKQ
jgi:hypothetical protein